MYIAFIRQEQHAEMISREETMMSRQELDGGYSHTIL